MGFSAKRLGRKIGKAFKSGGGKVKSWAGRATRGVVRAVNYNPLVGSFVKTDKEREAEKELKRDAAAEETGLRSAAAKRLVDTQRQAGGAQIKFTTEEYEE